MDVVVLVLDVIVMFVFDGYWLYWDDVGLGWK